MGFTRCRCDELVFLILTFVGLLPHDRTTRRPRRHALARRLTFKGTESLGPHTDGLDAVVHLGLEGDRRIDTLEVSEDLPLPLVGLSLRRIAGAGDASLDLGGQPPLVVLDDVGQLVGQQAVAGGGARRPLSPTEVDVGAGGERVGVEDTRRLLGGTVVVDAHVPEVAPECPLHPKLHPIRHGTPVAGHDLRRGFGRPVSRGVTHQPQHDPVRRKPCCPAGAQSGEIAHDEAPQDGSHPLGVLSAQGRVHEVVAHECVHLRDALVGRTELRGLGLLGLLDVFDLLGLRCRLLVDEPHATHPSVGTLTVTSTFSADTSHPDHRSVTCGTSSRAPLTGREVVTRPPTVSPSCSPTASACR